MIINPYTGHRLVVNCGHCPACLQEKANRRVNRILNTTESGEIVCFGTLTYDNKFVPYFEKSNYDLHSIRIYRKSFFCQKTGTSDFVLKKCPILLSTIHMNYKDEDIKMCRPLKNMSGCVGVLYFKDAQNFVKRFRENIKKYYGKDKTFKYTICGEYGGRNCRPHWHFLVWCFPNDFELFRRAFLESWKFHDLSKIDSARVFEQGANVASYVASYINCTSYVPSLLRREPFRQKSSSSRNFGVSSECFSLSQLEDCLFGGYFEYSFATRKNGVPVVSTLQIPSYVIDRFFPRFKGYSRLADDSLFECVANPQRLAKYAKILKYRYDDFTNDFHDSRVRLNNAFLRWANSHDLPSSLPVRNLYAFFYLEARRTARCSTWKSFYNSQRDELSSYDNLNDLVLGKCFNESLLDVLAQQKTVDSIEVDYNNFAPLVASTKSLEKLYFEKDKSKKVTQHVLQNVYQNF